jgi:SAF domain
MTTTIKPPATERTRDVPPAQPLPAAGGEPQRLRRRPAVIAAGIALVALGGLTAAWLAAAVSDTTSVLAVRTPVERGAVISDDDLVVASVNPDPNLHTIPADHLSAVVGQRAAVALAAGSLVTPDSVTAQVAPGPGQSLVGITVTPAQMPAEPLRAGDRVRIVDTPRPQDDPPAAAPPALAAVVVSTMFQDDSGNTVVNVTVPQTAAAQLAARAATGRIAIVKDSVAR